MQGNDAKVAEAYRRGKTQDNSRDKVFSDQNAAPVRRQLKLSMTTRWVLKAALSDVISRCLPDDVVFRVVRQRPYVKKLLKSMGRMGTRNGLGDQWFANELAMIMFDDMLKEAVEMVKGEPGRPISHRFREVARAMDSAKEPLGVRPTRGGNTPPTPLVRRVANALKIQEPEAFTTDRDAYAAAYTALKSVRSKHQKRRK